MMPSWCHSVPAPHPSGNSPPVLLPSTKTEALQSISGAEYQLSSLDFLKPETHFVLHSVAESCYRSCCGARLHFIFYSWLSGTQLPQCWGGTDAGLSPGTLTYRRAASEAQSAHPAEMWCLCSGPRGEEVEERWGLAGHLRRLEGGRSVKDTMGSVCVYIQKYTWSVYMWPCTKRTSAPCRCLGFF